MNNVDNAMQDWLLFSDSLAPEWCRHASDAIAKTIGEHLRLAVSLELPDRDAAKNAWDNNRTLYGRIVLSAGEESLGLRVPMTFDGVFIFGGSGHAQPYVWANWLGEKHPGIRRIENPKHPQTPLFRLAFPDGSHISVAFPPNGDSTKSWKAQRDRFRRAGKRILISRMPAAGNPDCPPWLSRFFENDKDWKQNGDKAFYTLYDLMSKHVQDFKEGSRLCDLAYREVVSFPRWLEGRLCGALRIHLEGIPEKSHPADGAAFLREVKSSFEKKDKDRTEALKGLVPLKLLRSKGVLMMISPCNPVELVARLTGVRRDRFSRKLAARFPEEARQNDSSFEGRLCPLETPESELVGLSLQLARRATVDADGAIRPADTRRPLDYLGWGTSLIPFLHFNDGARDMMGAKNLRQAVAVAGRQAPAVTTGAEDELIAKAARLVDIGICPNCTEGGHLALGRDLLVAYMPWNGWNVDDAVVLRRGVAKDFVIEERKVYSKPVAPGWSCEVPPERKDDSILHRGDVIATLRTRDGKFRQLVYGDSDEARLVRAPKAFEASDVIQHRLSYEIVLTLPIGPGDKVMARHGNKGVVGLVLDDDKMPRLPDDQALPEAMRGRPIDIIANPHGVLSRMNPGQLLEAHIGWLLHVGVEEASLCRQPKYMPIGTCHWGNVNSIRHDEVRQQLERSGLDRYGAIRLDLGGGSHTKNPVVVGYEHFVRLHHVPLLKAQARRGGAGAAYSPTSNQPVHGRMVGGGQRLGEMEVWALAAHGADSILREMLGAKSDGDMAEEWTDKSRAPVPNEGAGFPAMLKDWLFALGFDLVRSEDGKSFRFVFLCDEEIKSRIGVGRRVTNDANAERLQECEFGLPEEDQTWKQPGRNPGAQTDEILSPARISEAVKELKKCEFGLPGKDETWKLPGSYYVGPKDDALSISRFLESWSLRSEGLLFSAGSGEGGGQPVYRLNVRGLHRDMPDGHLDFSFDIRKGKEGKQASFPMVVSICLPDGNILSENGIASISCRYEGRGRPFSETLEAILHDEKELNDFLAKTRICHPDRKSEKLRSISRGALAWHGGKGSVFDEQLFGPMRDKTDDWGYIELPKPVSRPYWGNETAAPERPGIGVIPVLPLHYRMPSENQSDGEDPLSLNSLYEKLVRACMTNARDDGKETPGEGRPPCEKEVHALFLQLAKSLGRKEGILRHEGLGRRVDRSFRLVIAPDPELNWDEAGVPASIMWEMLGDLVEGEDPLHGHGRGGKTRRLSGGLSWHRPSRNDLDSHTKAELLKGYLARHPQTYVLLNRQPSLHRDSFQAFKPIVTDDADGEVMRLPPLCCKGFAADFDGDEMVGHFPLSANAKDEASRLSPECNLLSVATGKATFNYDRDLVTGLQLIYEHQAEYAQELENLELPECCRMLLEEDFKVRGEFGKNLIHHLCTSPDHKGASAVRRCGEWARLAWKACTDYGFSFGFYDLTDLAMSIGGKVKADDDVDEVKKSTAAALDNLLNQTDIPSGQRSIAIMVSSDANGKTQAPQILIRRGKLDALADSSRIIESRLIDGMCWRDLFDASWNARSSMCNKKLGTAKAGGLTRRLVLSLWPLSIVEDDCGNDIEGRSPLSCKSFEHGGGFCRRCYGALPTGEDAKIGDPVGLFAAQSIGERGTQLAMQTFHSGSKANGLENLRNLLTFTPVADRDFETFYKDIAHDARGKENEYAKLDKRHFMVLWRAWQAGLVKEPSKLADLLKGDDQYDKLVKLAAGNEGKDIPFSSPFAKVIFNLF